MSGQRRSRGKAMNALFHLRSRPWVMLLALLGVAAGHAIFFYVLRHAPMPHFAVSGIVLWGLILLIFAKHLGLFAALLRTLLHVFLRRSRPEESKR